MSSPVELPPPLEAVDRDPHRQFALWFAEAQAAGVHEPEAMTLATAAPDATPSARMVLMRGHGPEGYTWFTNYSSRKGRELDGNPRAALVFHWATQGRQIRIEGAVARTADAESDAYFATRHPDSQIGAWASPQSAPIAGRAELDARIADAARRHGGGAVERPPHWGGFRLLPTAFEFWQHRESRLHDRFRYTAEGGGWRIVRLAP